jgi:hypothetical protein
MKLSDVMPGHSRSICFPALRDRFVMSAAKRLWARDRVVHLACRSHFVQPAADGIVARIDKERPMHLAAVSDNNYVTMDGSVAMAFNRGVRGDEMSMSYVPRSNLAALVLLDSNLAGR